MKLLALTIAIVTSVAVVALLAKLMDPDMPWRNAFTGAAAFIVWITAASWSFDKLLRRRRRRR